MHKTELRRHKAQRKFIPGAAIEFGRHRLPKPLDKVVRSTRSQTTKLIAVSATHSVCFLWRDAPERVRSAFYAWLLLHNGCQEYLSLASLHYHPSHKPAHLVTPCGLPDANDFGTLGKGCPELHLKPKTYDPRNHQDRLKLIELLCSATGIEFTKGKNHDSAANQSLDLRSL